MTNRLYHSDPEQVEFTARVMDVHPLASHYAIVLDQTAFYPTGGGQPHDTGWLGNASVLDVVEDEVTGGILHIVETPQGFAAGDTVTGRIDRQRRLDHMQQHTGQHILSQAFVQAAGAETKGFHLGKESSTIDLDWDRPDETLIHRAEEIANHIVFENRPVVIHHVSREELATLPIRRDTFQGDPVRVIEIENYDYSPCCGTHAQHTGDVGLIALRGWERARKMVRVEFVCGLRALNDYRSANRAAKSVALMLSVGRDEAPEKVARLLDESKEQRRRIRELFDIAADVEADQVVRSAKVRSGFRVVRNLFSARPLDEIRILARKVCAREQVVALFGLEDKGAARLLFARSADLDLDMNELMKRVTAALKGRGGGSADLAQGGIADVERLADGIDLAVKVLCGE